MGRKNGKKGESKEGRIENYLEMCGGFVVVKKEGVKKEGSKGKKMMEHKE